MLRLLFLTILASALWAAPALAACTSPAGAASQTRYDFTANKLYYCNNTDWVEMGGTSGGGGGAPSGCTLPGARCDDGSILAGVVSNQTFYVTDANQSTSAKWATVNQANSGSQSTTDGKANQAWIVANRTLSQYTAFEICENLVRHGKSDWYLPSKEELNVLYANNSAIGGFGTGYFWSSSEYTTNRAWTQNFSNGVQDTLGTKSSSYGVRCVRRD